MATIWTPPAGFPSFPTTSARKCAPSATAEPSVNPSFPAHREGILVLAHAADKSAFSVAMRCQRWPWPRFLSLRIPLAIMSRDVARRPLRDRPPWSLSSVPSSLSRRSPSPLYKPGNHHPLRTILSRGMLCSDRSVSILEQVLAQRRALVLGAETPAPLQLRNQ